MWWNAIKPIATSKSHRNAQRRSIHIATPHIMCRAAPSRAYDQHIKSVKSLTCSIKVQIPQHPRLKSTLFDQTTHIASPINRFTSRLCTPLPTLSQCTTPTKHHLNTFRIGLNNLQFQRHIIRILFGPGLRLTPHNIQHMIAHKPSVNHLWQRKTITLLHTFRYQCQHLFTCKPHKILIVSLPPPIIRPRIYLAWQICTAQMQHQPILRIRPHIPCIAINFINCFHISLRCAVFPVGQPAIEHS